MIERPGLEQIDGSGATRGQVPVWNPDNGGVWEPGTPAAGGVSSVVPGNGVTVDNTDPAHPKVSAVALEPLTTEVWDGTSMVPQLVWDDDNQLVMTTAV